MHRYLCCSDACCRARLHIGKDCIGFGVGGSRGDLLVKDAVGPWRNRPLPNHRGQKEHKRVEPPAPRHPLHSAPLGLLFSFACAQYDEDTSLLSSLYVSPAGPGHALHFSPAPPRRARARRRRGARGRPRGEARELKLQSRSRRSRRAPTQGSARGSEWRAWSSTACSFYRCCARSARMQQLHRMNSSRLRGCFHARWNSTCWGL